MPMKYSKIIIPVLLLLLLSCAHRPRNQQFGKGTYSDRSEKRTEREDRPSRSTVRVKVKPEKPSGEILDGPEIFRRFSSAVFMVFTSNDIEGHQGSGFFIDDNGLGVSNYHVFKNTTIGQEQIKLVGSDIAYKVSEVIAKDEDHDFIVFRVNCNKNNYLKIARDKPEVGEKVFAIGSPRGLENTFSSGEISQWRSNEVIQTNVQIDHGSSGGPLINQYGQVVGITSGTFFDGSQANLNYAWSIDVIKSVLQ
jgi:serine protease Do